MNSAHRTIGSGKQPGNRNGLTDKITHLMENEIKPHVNFTTPEVTHVTAESITITWDYEIAGVPEDSVSFEVFLKGEKADGSPFDRVSAQEKNKCTLTGLKGETTYSLFVVAVHEGEDIAQFPDDDEGVVVTTPKSAPQTNWKKIALIAGCALAAIALAILLIFLLRDTKAPVISRPEVSSVIKDNEVSLSWNKATDNATAAENMLYNAYRTDEAGAWMDPVVIPGDSTYTFSGLKPWTEYKFRIEAMDEKGNKAPYTEVSVKTTDSVAPEVPKKTLMPDVGDDKIILSWSPAKDNVAGQKDLRYLVARTDESGEWTDAHEVKGDTTYAFVGLKPRVNYSLRVEAVDDAGNRSPYEDLTVATTDSSIPVIGKRELAVQTKDNEITIKWAQATDNVTEPKNLRYRVSRTNESGAWMSPQEVQGATSFTFTGLKTKTNYLCRVEVLDEAGNANSYDVLATATIDSGAPDVNNKTLSTSVKDNEIVLSWNAATDKGTTDPKNIRYKVYRTNDAGSWLSPQELRGQTSTTFKGLKSKTTYAFRVEAYDESNNMSRYNDKTVTTTDTKAPTVSNKTVTAKDIKEKSFTLTWSPATDVDQVTPGSKIRYKVYLRPSTASSWTSKEVIGTTSYAATNLSAKTTYLFFVTAFDESNNSVTYVGNNGTVFSATTLDTTAPTSSNTSVNLTKRAQNELTFQWAAARDNVTPANKIRYRIYWKELESQNWRSHDVVGQTSYTIPNLKAKTLYNYYVEAFDESGNRLMYGNMVNATSTSDTTAPTLSDRAISVTYASSSELRLKWTAAKDNTTPADKITYTIFWKINGSNGSYAKATVTGVTQYQLKSLKPLTWYTFYVQAKDASGNAVNYTERKFQTLASGLSASYSH